MPLLLLYSTIVTLTEIFRDQTFIVGIQLSDTKAISLLIVEDSGTSLCLFLMLVIDLKPMCSTNPAVVYADGIILLVHEKLSLKYEFIYEKIW